MEGEITHRARRFTTHRFHVLEHKFTPWPHGPERAGILDLEHCTENDLLMVDAFIGDPNDETFRVPLRRARGAERAAKGIIVCLAQIDYFQKRLFEKRNLSRKRISVSGWIGCQSNLTIISWKTRRSWMKGYRFTTLVLGLGS